MGLSFAVGSSVVRLAVATGFVLATILVLGAAPSIHALDSASLAAAGVRLGLSHPPGQPTHALLVKAASLLPLGDQAFRSNLVSVAGAAAAGLLVVLCALRLGARPAVAVASGVVLTLSGPVVEHATRTEVYAPALALGVLSVFLALPATTGTPGRARHCVGSGFSAGLAATLHPSAAIAAGLANLALWGRDIRRWPHFALGALLGLSANAYVVLRAAHDPAPLFDGPSRIEELAAFLLGSGYSSNFRGSPLEGLGEAGWLVLRGTGFIAIALGSVLAIARRDRTAMSLLVAAALALGPVSPLPFILQNADLEGYVLSSIALACLAFARSVSRTPWWVAALAAAAVLFGGGPGALRPRSRLVDAMADAKLDAMAPRAVLITDSDNFTGAVAFRTVAEGARPDVAWLAGGIASQRAPWPRIRAHDPALAPLPALAPVRGDVRDRLVVSLLARSHGRLFAYAESPSYLPGAPAAGAVFTHAVRRSVDRFRYERIRREHRGDSVEEGALRGAMMILADGLAACGEARAAGRALLVGLRARTSRLRSVVAALPVRANLLPEPPDAELSPRFEPDSDGLVRALARLAWRAGLGGRAVELLEAAFRSGSLEAAAQLAIFEALAGRPEIARSIALKIAARDPSRHRAMQRLLRDALASGPRP